MKNKKIDNNKKYIIEIILVTIFIGFLEYNLLNKFTNLIEIFYYILLSVISFELIISTIKKLYYKLNNIKEKILYIFIIIISLSTLFSIFNIVLIGSKSSIYTWITLISTIILSIYLIINGILALIKINKQKDNLGKNIKLALFSLLGAALTLIPFILNIK